MKYRPLSMHPSLVPAVLDGRKTMTRRPLKREHLSGTGWTMPDTHAHAPTLSAALARYCPLGAVGDGLWLRERARVVGYHERTGQTALRYEADRAVRWMTLPSRLRPVAHGHCIPNGVHKEGARWHGAILEVRVERVQDISEADAWAEGVSTGARDSFGPEEPPDEDPREVGYSSGAWGRDNFRRLWDSIYGPDAWERNDWVWVVRWKTLEAKP